jgi:hypothetical protein
MEIRIKTHQKNSTQRFIKTNNLFFIYNGVNCKSSEWLVTEQSFKKINFNCRKITNKPAKIAIKKSIYSNIKFVLTGIVFFIVSNDSSKILSKKVLFNKLESLLFVLSAAKLNNKIYSVQVIKNLSFLNYLNNNLLCFQFLTANVIICSKNLIKSK